MWTCNVHQLALLAVLATSTGAASEESRSRTFLFTYGGTITGLPAGKLARVWLPLPPSNDDQQVKIVSKTLPARERLGRDAVYGNQILFFEAKGNENGEAKFTVKYLVTRRELKTDARKNANETETVTRFLQADARVPIEGKPLELLKTKTLPEDQLEAARVLYDVVNGHMRYSKEGNGWGRGDAVWACDSGFGNCSDFHSLFIALARSRKIPAKFEIGFSLPEKRGGGDIPGYHCWAKFKPAGKNWVPVDISEANKNPKRRDYYFGNLSPDRVVFSVGRDIELVPRQDGGLLNFFVYPYVEVEGKPYEKVKRVFTFQDEE